MNRKKIMSAKTCVGLSFDSAEELLKSDDPASIFSTSATAQPTSEKSWKLIFTL